MWFGHRIIKLLFNQSVVSDSWWPPWTPGVPALHYLSDSTQTHVHWVSDAIQPSQPLPPPSPHKRSKTESSAQIWVLRDLFSEKGDVTLQWEEQIFLTNNIGYKELTLWIKQKFPHTLGKMISSLVRNKCSKCNNKANRISAKKVLSWAEYALSYNTQKV